MTNEINKIACNVLASGNDLHLPSVGSLTVEWLRAARISRTEIVPPRKRVTFVQQTRGISLADEIARIGGIDSEQAKAVYEKWLDDVRSGDGEISIEGVGRLHDGKFTMSDEFAALINPQGTETIRIKRRPDIFIYVFSAACCLFAIGVALFIWRGIGEQKKEAQPKMEIADIKPAPVDTATTETAETAETAETVQIAESPSEEIQAVAEMQKPEPMPEAGNGVISRTVSGRSYVVLGVFSTEENAARASQNAGRSGNADCRTYRYGSDKFLVSLYESDSRAECQNYMRSASGTFDNLWIYTRK